jgi:hypothetical protein
MSKLELIRLLESNIIAYLSPMHAEWKSTSEVFFGSRQGESSTFETLCWIKALDRLVQRKIVEKVDKWISHPRGHHSVTIMHMYRIASKEKKD